MGTRVLMLGILWSCLISCCRADPALWFEQEPGQLIQYISPCLINLCPVESEFNLSAYTKISYTVSRNYGFSIVYNYCRSAKAVCDFILNCRQLLCHGEILYNWKS
jgi:hypothetical protein